VLGRALHNYAADNSVVLGAGRSIYIASTVQLCGSPGLLSRSSLSCCIW